MGTIGGLSYQPYIAVTYIGEGRLIVDGKPRPAAEVLKEHGIEPRSIVKEIRDVIEISSKADVDAEIGGKKIKRMTRAEKQMLVEKLTREMKNAAKLLEFEHAAYLRDRIQKLRESK